MIITCKQGLALMAGRSKVKPLPACYVSTLPGFESLQGHEIKLPVTRIKTVVFDKYSGFLLHFQLGRKSQINLIVWQKSTDNKNLNTHIRRRWKTIQI